MYWSINVNYKALKHITLSSVCISGTISGQFRKVYPPFPQYLFIDFILNFRAGTKI